MNSLAELEAAKLGHAYKGWKKEPDSIAKWEEWVQCSCGWETEHTGHVQGYPPNRENYPTRWWKHVLAAVAAERPVEVS